MTFKKLRQSLIAVWFGVFALAVSGLEQNQLAGNVSQAVVAEAGIDAVAPASPAVAVHPADCPMHMAGGHTHKGHADCAVCGVVAALAAITLPIVAVPMGPVVSAQASPVQIPVASLFGRHSTPYSSRAPPSVA